MNIDAQREHDAKTGGSIFPTTFTVDGEQVCAEGSLTLRDYFAAKILPSIMKDYRPCKFDLYAKRAYEMADAMLLARSKP